MYNYEITPRLLKLIKSISLQIQLMDNQRFTNVVLMELQKSATELSSYSSTSIEGNPLPLTEVRKILKSRPKQIIDSEREVIQYNDTLIRLNDLVRSEKFKLEHKTIVTAHSQLMKGLLPKIKLNIYRKESVFVNNPKTRKAIFLPPDHQDVHSLMTKLVNYVNENIGSIDPLILAGIFHKQFVLIHPFVDGNGRTVRLITKALLASLGIDTFFLFSFENYYNQNVSKYFSKVGERGDYYDLADKLSFTEWLEYFCEGILDELYRVQKIITQHTASPSLVSSEVQNKILTFIDKHGYIKDVDYAKFTNRAKATRTLDFNKLIKMNLIERHGKGPATYYKRKI